MTAIEKATDQPGISEHLVIIGYSIQSTITVDSRGSNPNCISYTILMLSGVASPPYAITGIQIKFVPDGQPLAKPSWQSPNLACEKHRSEYVAIMDMINKGIDAKKSTGSFTADYQIDSNRLVLILS